MDNIEFNRNLEISTREFATKIVEFSATLPDTPEGKVIRNQLTLAGTSIGANYREAIRAKNKTGILNNIKNCESESGETIYWLEIIGLMDWDKGPETESLLQEANELFDLFTSIGVNLNSKTTTFNNSQLQVL